nr:Imd [Lineus ruber]
MALMQNPKQSVEVAKDPKPSVLEVDSVVIGSSSEIGDGDGEIGDVKAGLDCLGANAGDQDQGTGSDIGELTQRTSQMSVRPKDKQPELNNVLPGADSHDEIDAARAIPFNTYGAGGQANAVGEETKTIAVMKQGTKEIKYTERKRRIHQYDKPAQYPIPAFNNCQFNSAVITGGTFGDFNQTYQSMHERNQPALDVLDNHVVTDHAVSLSDEFADLLNCVEQISIDDILDIAEEIGGNWVALGRKLETKTATMDNIKCQCHYVDQQEMCVLLLEEWQERVSEDAVISEVTKALIDLKCKGEDVVPAILEKLSDRHKCQ